MIHILPTVPPAINGLADYCYKLWEHWPAPDAAWHCLALRIPPGAADYWPQANLSTFEPSFAGLSQSLAKLDDNTVVLHYVGYAYHPKGIPLWLPRVLKRWKAKTPVSRLYVMFHELWARARPNQSAFWLTPWARGIVTDLSREADGWVVSCEAWSHRLVHEAGADRRLGHIIPIGTGIEPAQQRNIFRNWPLNTKTKLKVAFFGLPSTRLGTLRMHRHLLRALRENNLLERISLIGKSGDASDARVLSALQVEIAPVEQYPDLWSNYYDLAPERLSNVLCEHDLGFTHYPPSLLTKSSIYAALCAHGLLVVCGPETTAGEFARAFPCIANDDAQPLKAIHLLYDAAHIAMLQQQAHTTTQGVLSWNNITRAWATLIAPSDAESESL